MSVEDYNNRVPQDAQNKMQDMVRDKSWGLLSFVARLGARGQSAPYDRKNWHKIITGREKRAELREKLDEIKSFFFFVNPNGLLKPSGECTIIFQFLRFSR